MPIDFSSVFRALAAAQVRYVLVGGLAVMLHGVDRVTADIDLTVDLAPEQAKNAFDALLRAGLRPQLPISPSEFADAAKRLQWRRERNMEVFSFWDPLHERPTVDLFVENPISFAELWEQSVTMQLDQCAVRVASIAHLIQLKRLAGRERDLTDITALHALLEPP